MAARTARRAERRRLDLELVARGIAPSRERAQALILGGAVRVDGEPVRRPSALVAPDAEIASRTGPDYVGRGAEKLIGALDDFGISVAARICVDVGSSTGGFTDVLLRREAKRVYAIDVGKGQLAWRLRQDERVVVMEGQNVRDLRSLPEPIDLAVADVSFISLALALPPVVPFLAPGADVVALVKPQFEAGPRAVSRGGVVRDPAARAAAVRRVVDALARYGLGVRHVARSRLRGREGNVEVFCHLRLGPADASIDLDAAIAEASA